MKRTKDNKKPQKLDGTTVRISRTSFDTIKLFCEQNGFKIGRFIELAALNRINRLNDNK